MNILKKSFDALSRTQIMAIFQLRQRVFMLEQQSLYLDIDGHDQVALHFLWLDGEQLAGYSRLLPPGHTYEGAALGRLVIDAAYRRKGGADLLMRAMLEQATHCYPQSSLYLSAQLQQIPRYERYGFIGYGDVYDDGGVMHKNMKRPAG